MTVGTGSAADREAAVVVACGGTGARFGGGSDEAKQFRNLAGQPVIAHTLSALERQSRVANVVLVLPGALCGKGEALACGRWPDGAEAGYPKVLTVVEGGADRQASVANGLHALEKHGWQGPVLVHDGVRPCTPSQVFDRVLDSVHARGNGVAAIPVRDTIKRADARGIVRETVDRRGLWQIQTPQGFWMQDIVEAYEEGLRRSLRATDDAALLEALGRTVYLVEGDPSNIKLTYPEDMILLEALLGASHRIRV